MFGNKLKSWMESHFPRVRNHYYPSSRSSQSFQFPYPPDEIGTAKQKRVHSSSSTDTTGSFIQNLSSPDTGYSTDGYSPKSSCAGSSNAFHDNHLSQPSNHGLLQLKTNFSLTSQHQNHCHSPKKPPRLKYMKQQQRSPEDHQLIRNSITSSDSGQGTLPYFGNCGIVSTISEEPSLCSSVPIRETDILSDWAPTDEDVDEGVLTPTPPPAPNTINETNIFPLNSVITDKSTGIPALVDMPKAYETLHLLNQCNHVFPLPSCTAPRCLAARLEKSTCKKSSSNRNGPLGFLRKLFKIRKSGTHAGRCGPENDSRFPEYSHGNKPIVLHGPTSWLTPTPNSFRRRHTIKESSDPLSPRGVKSDIIRLPQTTPAPTPLPAWTPTPLRQSPFHSCPTPIAASPASIRQKPQQIVTPILARIAPEQSPQHQMRLMEQSPLFNKKPGATISSFTNYSPMHRLVVTRSGASQICESPLVRTSQLRPIPPPPPLPAQLPNLPSVSATRNSKYQYICSSNQNSPVLKREIRAITGNQMSSNSSSSSCHPHHYASPLSRTSIPMPQHQTPQQTFDVDRIYEQVSDEGDGEGGDYEWDVSLGESEQSHSQESSKSKESGRHSINYAQHLPGMTLGGRLSETEARLLEREADLKYKRLLWEAEVLLREFTAINNLQSGERTPTNIPDRQGQHPFNNKTFRINTNQSSSQRYYHEECPQSDPLRRKNYECWALRRLQQEFATSCASPPVLHRSRHSLVYNNNNSAQTQFLPNSTTTRFIGDSNSRNGSSQTLHNHNPNNNHYYRL